MKLRQSLVTQLMACGLLACGLNSALVTMQGSEASAAGTWKWSFTTQNGQTYETTLKLKQAGDQLTGVVIGRNNTETAIEAGKIEGNELSFKVVRERNGEKFTMNYQGKLAGDTIKGTTSFERDGQTQSREWEAKRDKPPVDPTGTWKWTFTPPNGQAMESTLKLKLADGKLAGTLTGRSGTEIAIENAKLNADEITFSVTRERNGQTVTSKYAGKITGDVLKGKIEMGSGDQARSRDWEAKREKAVNATGTWQWTMKISEDQTVERKLTLKQDGDKLTGVSIWNENETPIEAGKVQGNEVSFQVVRERDGNKITVKYHGQLDGDTLKGKIEANWGGEDRSFDWDAKRIK